MENNQDFNADMVRNALRSVIDPEIGINIVDIGLVYRIEIRPDKVEVDMTMTSPACPMGEMLKEDVAAALEHCVPDAYEIDLRLVWAPAWSPEMMSEAARKALGWGA